MELIQRNKRKAEALGLNLRDGSRKSLRRRRSIFGLFLAASASMSVIALYQLGILKHIPEPHLSIFDSAKVTGSPKAYSLLQTPDAVLALGSYAATMTLAAMGSSARATEHPMIPLTLAAKVGLDSALALKYTFDELVELSGVVLLVFAQLRRDSRAAVPLAIAEGRAALRSLNFNTQARNYAEFSVH